MANIKDIAKKAGVSISTVSYALNGSTKITRETAAKIQAIADELNYIPNAAGRNLKKKQTRIIGTFIEDYTGSFFGPLLKGMRTALNSQQYELIVCSGKHSHRFIPEGLIDGAIILDCTFPDEELLKYAERGHKLVVLDRELEHPNINQVLLDNEKGATLAIDYLMKKGHNKVYVLPGHQRSYDARMRLKAVRQTITKYPQLDYIEFKNGTWVEDAAQQIVDTYSHPVALFCYNDEAAIDFYHFFAETPYRVGEHIHIIGFDNIDYAKFLQPRLTTIDIPREQWGFLSANQLLKLMSNEPISPQLIDVALIEGQSVRTRQVT